MNKLTLITLLMFYSFIGNAQHDVMVFRKKNRTITLYLNGSYIAFQDMSRQWFSGYITKVQNDSFYLRPLEVIYGAMQIDTLYTDIIPFALTDVYAMPKKGVEIDYMNGDFKINMSGGHIHWYWIKGGWLFRVLGAGYATLVVANGLIQNDLSFSGAKLGIAAAVFLFGELLHLNYKLTLRLGKKYFLETIKVSNRSMS
jgi:hypothetical protein